MRKLMSLLIASVMLLPICSNAKTSAKNGQMVVASYVTSWSKVMHSLLEK